MKFASLMCFHSVQGSYKVMRTSLRVYLFSMVQRNIPHMLTSLGHPVRCKMFHVMLYQVEQIGDTQVWLVDELIVL